MDSEWVLLPKKAPRAMLDCISAHADSYEQAQADYTAMLAAAPPPPAEQASGDADDELQAYREMHLRLDCLLGQRLAVTRKGDYKAAIENTVESIAALSQRPVVSPEAVKSAVLNMQPLAHRNDGTRLWQMFEDFETAEHTVSEALASQQPTGEEG